MSQKKMVGRNVAIALGIACIILIAGLGGAMAYYTMQINNKNAKYNDELNTYNNYVSDHHSTDENYDSLQNQYNSEVQQYNSEVEQYNVYVADHHYTDEDYNSLRNLTITSMPYGVQAVYSTNVTFNSNSLAATMVPIPFEGSFAVGGYSRMVVSVGISGMSAGSNTLNIALVRVVWITTANPGSTSTNGLFEDNMEDYYNATIYRYITNWQIYGTHAIPIETEGPYAGLLLSCYGETPSWAVMDVFVYLRNE